MFKSAKAFAKKLIYGRIRGAKIGRNSILRWPRTISFPRQLTIGQNCYVGKHFIVSSVLEYAGKRHDGKVVIGDGVYIGGYCQLHSMGLVEIGDGCVLSEHVYISDIAHGLDPAAGPIMEQPLQTKGPAILGKRCFLGFGASVLPGVTLGDHCIVGARSVVTRSFPAGSMIAGAPARLLKRYDKTSGRWVSEVPELVHPG